MSGRNYDPLGGTPAVPLTPPATAGYRPVIQLPCHPPLDATLVYAPIAHPIAHK